MKLIQGILFCLSYPEYVAHCCKYLTRDCQDVLDLGFRNSGVYHVTPPGTFRGADVYCDMVTDGGGWIVVQRRINGSEDFFRGWEDYQTGFGNISGEFWIGNLFLHIFTSAGFYEIRFDMEIWDGNKVYAQYKIFKVEDSTTNYQLTISGFSGDTDEGMRSHNGKPFTTKDRDNDLHATYNCAESYPGAWWYYDCYSANLNGLYLNDPGTGVQWNNLKVKKSEMKIRRR